ncbi:hypothetical protein V8C86DRAFT_91754 [Haematococcus lacustris]
MPKPAGSWLTDGAPVGSDHRRSRNACMDLESVDPRFQCKSFCCVIQDCLARYDYNQSMCSREIEQLVECCSSLARPEGSLHCMGFMNLVRKRQREQQHLHHHPHPPPPQQQPQ